MPLPQPLGIGDRMGRGGYDKSGLLVEWGLHPLEEKKVDYEFSYPLRTISPNPWSILWKLNSGTSHSAKRMNMLNLGEGRLKRSDFLIRNPILELSSI